MTKEQIDEEFRLIEDLKRLVRESVCYAEDAHKAVFDKHSNISVAIAYLQRASVKMSAAESLYLARFDVLERAEAEEIFRLFDVFADELVTNFATEHSHQWTDIEFNHLMECFNYSAFAFENA